MNILISILIKTLVRQFYQQHTGFFLLVIGICFGFMSGIEHKALAQFFVSSPWLLGIPVLLWALYTVQIILFNRKIIQQPECEFLYVLSLLPKLTLIAVLTPVLLLQLMPVILYSTFLILTAFQVEQLQIIGCIITAVFVLLASGVLLLIYTIQNPNPEKQHSSLVTLLNLNFKRAYFQFCIGWMFRKEFMALLGTKLFSGLLIFLVCVLYSHEAYDERLLAMGLSVAFAGNAFLLYQYHAFENMHFIILRNLPLSLPKRLFNFSIVFLIICLPEFVVLYHNFPVQFGIALFIQAALFGSSIMILLYGLRYAKSFELDTFIKYTFSIAFVFVVIILFRMPWWIITACSTVTGLFMFNKYYYAFEGGQH